MPCLLRSILLDLHLRLRLQLGPWLWFPLSSWLWQLVSLLQVTIVAAVAAVMSVVSVVAVADVADVADVDTET